MKIVLVDEDGVALTYTGTSPDPAGREYVAVAAAYDQDGHQRQRNLRDLFRIRSVLLLIKGADVQPIPFPEATWAFHRHTL